ncbi:hypothetical protein BC938DRAFT_476117 [Jimgerdemannia flammicorona]|uniref:CHHC U11-48K-type domain-containing protein n=1 Tax=Jimgerdemannia flammicorona TaxID=994334 RepID=A0A433PK34_9FUNG|nr:hypothetical protein BC938DRAFT_476117 [Jimgerdemannia flammicorona]
MSELNEEELRERPNDVRKLRSSADALKSQLDSILNVLKMTPDELEQTHNGSELLRTCPFNSLHRVTKESFDAHFKTCQLAYYGIKSERKPKLPSSMFFYLNAPSVVSLLDKEPSVTASAISPQNIIHVAPDPTPQPNVSSISTVEQRDAAYVRDSELGSRLRSEHQVPTCYELPNLDEALERARSFKGILFLLGLVACILLKTAYEVVGNAGDHGDASFCCSSKPSLKRPAPNSSPNSGTTNGGGNRTAPRSRTRRQLRRRDQVFCQANELIAHVCFFHRLDPARHHQRIHAGLPIAARDGN